MLGDDLDYVVAAEANPDWRATLCGGCFILRRLAHHNHLASILDHSHCGSPSRERGDLLAWMEALCGVGSHDKYYKPHKRILRETKIADYRSRVDTPSASISE
jgi:hypothetical protein